MLWCLASLLGSTTRAFVARKKAADASGVEPGKWTYPYYSLPDVIEFAKIVQQIGGKEVAERQVLKKLRISNRVTRSWSYRLSSAKEFGLLDRKGRKEEARLVVMELCVRVSTSSGERRDGAIRSAFLKPPLYGKLTDRYLGVPAPSVEDLASVLVRDFGLVDSVAERAARAFLDSARFAGVITADGHVGSVATVGEGHAAARSPQKAVVDLDSETSEVASPTDGLIAHRFQLRPDVTIVVRLPPDLNQSDVTRLQKWLRTLPFEDSEE